MTPTTPSSPPQADAPATPATDNPLLAEWTGPYGGVPPFDKVAVDQFTPAFDRVMADTLAEIDRIATSTEPPTFDNTIAALERAMEPFDRVRAVYGVWIGAVESPELQEVERKVAPELAEFGDKITQNAPLFARIEAVYQARARDGLSPEQARLTWLYYNRFVRAGARLDPAAKARVLEINQKLAGLYARFRQNVLADETDQFLTLDDEKELDGLPPSVRDAAAAEAVTRGLPGKWVISNTRSSVVPFLTYSNHRGLRERVWRMFVDRGDGGGPTDNNAVITQILALRAECAKLLGYPTWAHWRTADMMAKTPEHALELMERVWTPAVARVHSDVRAMQALADRDKAGIKIEPWDYRYYAEKVRKQKYDLDETQLQPYLQLDKLREAMFWVAGELYGFGFRPVTDVPVFDPDVKVWEVVDRTTGKHIGLWYFDPFARKGKRSGAWMTEYREQQRMDGAISPIVSNNANFMKGKPGEPILISWDDATTLFHEFGHALHGLASDVTYPSRGGQIYQDFVELPSQLMEHWLATPEVLQRFAVHYQTGQPIPRELVDRIEQARTFNQGFDTVEYLADALIDMKIHLAGSQKIDPDRFERETLAELGMPGEIALRHRLPQFNHIFASVAYSAGYYSYLWADVLVADAFQAFLEAGGPYDKTVARRFYDDVLSVGNTVDPGDAYRKFRGHDADVTALLRDRGFAVKPRTK